MAPVSEFHGAGAKDTSPGAASPETEEPKNVEHPGEIVEPKIDDHRGEIVDPKVDHHRGEIVEPEIDHHRGEIVEPKIDHHRGEIVEPKIDDYRDEVVEPKIDDHRDKIVESKIDKHQGEIVEPKIDKHQGEIVEPKNVEHPAEIVEPKIDDHQAEIVKLDINDHQGEIVEPKNVEHQGEIVEPKIDNHQAEIVKPEIDDHQGEIVDPKNTKTQGEATLRTFDDVLDCVGLGLWQLPIIMAPYLSQFFSAPNLVGPTFQDAPTEFGCLVSDDRGNTTGADWLDSECPTRGSSVNGNSSFLDDVDLTMCCKKLHFDTSVFTSTFTSEYGLVCDRQYLAPFFQVALALGLTIGDILGGLIADRFGRRIPFIVASLTAAVATTTLTLVHSLPINFVCRFTIGLTITGGCGPSFTSLMESVPARHRATIGVMVGAPYSFGSIYIAFVGFFVRDWRLMQAFIIVPTVVMIIVCLFLDESPRWLARQGRATEALEVLTKAARKNKTQLPSASQLEKCLLMMKEEKSPHSGSSESSFLVTLKTPKMRVITVVNPMVWVFQSVIWLGIPLNANNITSSPFLYVMLTGLVELPAAFLGGKLTNSWGRVTVLIVLFFVTGSLSLLSTAVPREMNWLQITLVMIAMSAAGFAYMVNYTLAPELFPTSIRARGVSLSAAIGHSGYNTLPYITRFLGAINPQLPTFIYGACGIMASLSLFLLPETGGVSLCETIEDVEARPLFYETVLGRCRGKKEKADPKV